jgi:LysR family glycine cleavage system transcriptional activator
MNRSDTGPAEIPFRSLIAFEAVARLSSVSRAADELHLTQSAVSQRVLKLEAHVGQRLFARHGHGVKLTSAGELLLATTRETLERLRAGFARIEPYRNKSSLLLACPFDFAHGWLMPRLPALHAAHGGVEVWLMPERELTGIDRIDVDLIVSRRPLHSTEIECVPLLEDAVVAVAGPRTAERLAGVPFPRVLERAPLLFDESEPEWGGWLSEALFRNLALRRAATIEDQRLLLDAVERELGIARLPRVLVSDAVAAGRLRVLEAVPAQPRPSLWLMRSTLTPRTPLANRVFAWLLAQTPPARQ